MPGERSLKTIATRSPICEWLLVRIVFATLGTAFGAYLLGVALLSLMTSKLLLTLSFSLGGSISSVGISCRGSCRSLVESYTLQHVPVESIPRSPIINPSKHAYNTSPRARNLPAQLPICILPIRTNTQHRAQHTNQHRITEEDRILLDIALALAELALGLGFGILGFLFGGALLLERCVRGFVLEARGLRVRLDRLRFKV
jgi:hypothetical protein